MLRALLRGTWRDAHAKKKNRKKKRGGSTLSGFDLNLGDVLGRHAALNALTWLICLIASYEGGRKEPSSSGCILSPLLRGSARSRI